MNKLGRLSPDEELVHQTALNEIARSEVDKAEDVNYNTWYSEIRGMAQAGKQFFFKSKNSHRIFFIIGNGKSVRIALQCENTRLMFDLVSLTYAEFDSIIGPSSSASIGYVVKTALDEFDGRSNVLNHHHTFEYLLELL